MRSDGESNDLAPPIAAPLSGATTERLLLSRFEPDDFEELVVAFSHPEVWWFPFGRAFTRHDTQEFLNTQIKEWEDRGFGLWATRIRTTGQLIGFVGLSVPTFLPEILPAVEVGWRLIPSAWDFGYATEAATAALAEAFTTLGLDRVCSLPQSDNPKSLRVAERLGMKRVRHVTIPPTERRGEVAAILYEVDREGWQALHGSIHSSKR